MQYRNNYYCLPIAIIILHNYNTHDTDECTTVDLLCTCNTYKLGIIGAAGTGGL